MPIRDCAKQNLSSVRFFASTHRIFFLRSGGRIFLAFVLFLVSSAVDLICLCPSAIRCASPAAVARSISIYKRNFVLGLWLSVSFECIFSLSIAAANDTGSVNSPFLPCVSNVFQSASRFHSRVCRLSRCARKLRWNPWQAFKLFV